MIREKTFLLSIIILITAMPCEGALHAFWGNAKKDGYTQELTLPEGLCPIEHEATAVDKGIIGACQTSYKPIALGYVWDRIFFSFNTLTLETETIDSAVVKIIVHQKIADDWETNLLIDFVADCISFELSVGDTACYVNADTMILYSELPEVGDTLTIAMRPTWVNRAGATEIVMISHREDDVCAATGSNVIKLRTTEYSGTACDPRLYVWTSDEDPLRRHVPTKKRFRTSGVERVPEVGCEVPAN